MDDSTADDGNARRPVDGARPRRRWLRPRWIVPVVLIVLVAWAIIVAVTLVRAEHRLQAGMASAEQARQSLTLQDIQNDTAQGQLTVAADDFVAAHHDVTSAWLSPLRVVPIIGTQVRSVSDLSGSASAVATAGTQTLGTVHRLLIGPHRTPAERTSAIGRLATTLATFTDTVDHLDFGPHRGLIGPLATKRTTFIDDVAKVQSGLNKADGATAALAQVLRGPTTYLVGATNNAEMRAGSGMILQAGTLHLDDGRFALGTFAPTGALVDTHTALLPTGDLKARWGFEDPTVDFRELLLSPQFPANASLAAEMWRERTGQGVQGFITLDIGALEDLLGATGPITVDGTTYTQANVAQQLLITQYVGISNASALNAERHQKQADLAEAVFLAINRGSTSLTALATAFDQAVIGRHLMVWASNSKIEADWMAAGAGGSVGSSDLLLSLLNQGANKLDPYQQVAARVDATSDGSRTAVTVRVTVDNTTPTTLSGYAAGGAPDTPPARQYTGAVALDFPPSAVDVTSSGGSIESEGPDGGAQVVAVPAVAIPRGTSKTVTFHFVLAGPDPVVNLLPSARLPPTSWTVTAPGRPTLTINDAIAHSVPL